jgi:Transposase
MVMKSRKKQNVESRNRWRQHINQWAETGLSQAEYCREHGLRQTQFCYWKKQFLKTKKFPLQIVQIPTPIKIDERPEYLNENSTCYRQDMKIILKNGIQVVLSDDFSAKGFKKLIIVINEVC